MAEPTLSDDSTETEDRRLKYRALVDYDDRDRRRCAFRPSRFSLPQLGSSSVSFYYSCWTGGLLLAITLGLWIIDLRNRDMLSKFRDWGEIVEDGLLIPESRQFRDRTGVAPEVRFGLFFFKALDDPRPGPTPGSHSTLGIDIIFLGVIVFAIALLCGVTRWSFEPGCPTFVD